MNLENLQRLCDVLSVAKRAADKAWSKLSPEKKNRICDNLLKRAEERIKAKRAEGGPQ